MKWFHAVSGEGAMRLGVLEVDGASILRAAQEGVEMKRSSK